MAKTAYRSTVEEIRKIKEIIYFFDVLNELPSEITKRDSSAAAERIPVILSADNNYSCFVATTGASILYNTTSFIEFYILSEGITESNKLSVAERKCGTEKD